MVGIHYMLSLMYVMVWCWLILLMCMRGNSMYLPSVSPLMCTIVCYIMLIMLYITSDVDPDFSMDIYMHYSYKHMLAK